MSRYWNRSFFPHYSPRDWAYENPRGLDGYRRDFGYGDRYGFGYDDRRDNVYFRRIHRDNYHWDKYIPSRQTCCGRYY